AQSLDPRRQRLPRGSEQPLALFARELRREAERRQTGRVEDLIRIRVADAIEQPGVGERALERVRLPGQRRSELLERRAEHIQSTGVVGGERALAPDDVE